MEFNEIEVSIDGAGEGGQQNVSLYSDIHLGSEHCDKDALLRHMRRRAKLPNSRFLLLGDNWDFVLPRDLRRFMPSESVTQGQDDVLNIESDMALDFFKEFPIDLMMLGNHEYEVLRRHHYDAVRYVARQLREVHGQTAIYGGYSGMLRYKFRTDSDDKGAGLEGPRSTTFLLHHGSGGGKVSKGYGWARDFGRGFEGWDVLAYGHNHQSNAHVESVTRLTRSGKFESRNVFYVNTGTWNRTIVEHKMGYGERRGYQPTPVTAPLITLTPTRAKGIQIAVSQGAV